MRITPPVSAPGRTTNDASENHRYACCISVIKAVLDLVEEEIRGLEDQIYTAALVIEGVSFAEVIGRR